MGSYYIASEDETSSLLIVTSGQIDKDEGMLDAEEAGLDRATPK